MATIVQHVLGGASGTASFNIALAATGAGHLLVVAIGIDSGSTSTVVNSVSDGTTAFTHDTSADAVNTAGDKTQIWYLLSSNAGKTSIAVTMGGNAFVGGDCYEVSGATSWAVDAENVVNNGTSANPNTNPTLGASVTPSAAVLFGLGIIYAENGTFTQNPQTGNEFTSGGDIDVTNSNACIVSLLTTVASAHQPAWANGPGASSAQPYCASTIFFKDSGAVATPVLPDLMHQRGWMPLLTQ